MPEPVHCGIFAREIEVLHLRVDEMIRDVRHDVRDGAVRDDRNFSDFLEMRFQKLKVRKHRAEVFPAGKRFGAYQYAIQLSMPLQRYLQIGRKEGRGVPRWQQSMDDCVS